jgi:hypothetical protein
VGHGDWEADLMHAYQIGNKIKEIIEQLLTDLTSELPSNPEIARSSLKPYVNLQKGKPNMGRDDPKMSICEGITIVPLKPSELPGTNEREDMGYQYFVSVAQGTMTEDFSNNWRVGVWEQNIRQRFQQRRLGVTLDSACELGCTVTAGALPEWAELKDGVDASFMTITCFVRESRRG